MQRKYFKALSNLHEAISRPFGQTMRLNSNTYSIGCGSIGLGAKTKYIINTRMMRRKICRPIIGIHLDLSERKTIELIRAGTWWKTVVSANGETMY